MGMFILLPAAKRLLNMVYCKLVWLKDVTIYIICFTLPCPIRLLLKNKIDNDLRLFVAINPLWSEVSAVRLTFLNKA